MKNADFDLMAWWHGMSQSERSALKEILRLNDQQSSELSAGERMFASSQVTPEVEKKKLN